MVRAFEASLTVPKGPRYRVRREFQHSYKRFIPLILSFMQGKCELSYSQQQSDFQFEPKTAVLDLSRVSGGLELPLP